jgi:glycosyltransferase involved in cell wall biosynthesis
MKLLMAGRTRYPMPLTASLARKFAALADEVEISVLGTRGAVTGDIDQRFTLIAPIGPQFLEGALFYVRFPRHVARALRRLRPDAILVQGAHEGALALLGRKLARVPVRVIVDVHGDPAAATRLYGSPLRRLLAVPTDALARWALRHADGVRTISEYTSRLVRDLGVEPSAEFPAFMDLEPFVATPPSPLPDPPVVLFVGVLERYKAPDVLADAWRLVAARVPDVQLRLVGQGTLTGIPRSLMAAFPDRVTWAPSLPTAAVAGAMDGATVLVLPSRSEGLGRVVIEAFCRGRGVVGSRVGGIPDVVTDGVDGLLVPPGDASALAVAIERAVTEPGLAEQLGAAARSSVEPWLATPEQYATRIRELVTAVCAEKAPG